MDVNGAQLVPLESIESPNPLSDKLEGEGAKFPYLCPGESQSISRSLHLARLAAGYVACQNCTLRGDTGTLPEHVVQSVKQRWQAGPGDHGYGRHSLAIRDPLSPSLRGIYLNQITRPVIMNVVEHALELHAEFSHANTRNPFSTSSAAVVETEKQLDRTATSSLHFQPRVLVAHDWRPSSPDLVVGVVSVLRRWGCEIADLGQVNRACFDFAMSRFHAELGLFITGGTGPEKVNGLDILSADGIEWSHPGRLTELRARLDLPANRFDRQAGHYQSLPMTENYAAHVSNVLQGIHSNRIALACGEPLTLQILGGELLEHGCEVQFLDLNFADLDFRQQTKQFRSAVRESHVDVGFLIRSDGQSISVFDERARQLSTKSILRLLIPKEKVVSLHPANFTKTAEFTSPDQPPTVDRSENVSIEQQLTAMRQNQFLLTTDDAGRFWISDASPQCDSVHVVSRVLRVLQSQDLPLSALAKQVHPHI